MLKSFLLTHPCAPVKPHLRVLGIDDGPFTFEEGRALFTGVMVRLPSYVEAIAIGSVEIDGTDATEQIAEMLTSYGWKGIHAILIDGAALGGFNIVDIVELSERTGIPVITVTHERPDMDSIKEALKSHFDMWEERYHVLESREIHEISVEEGRVYISFHGTDLKGAKEIVRKSIVRGLTPEAIRLAHMVGRAVREAGYAP